MNTFCLRSECSVELKKNMTSTVVWTFGAYAICSLGISIESLIPEDCLSSVKKDLTGQQETRATARQIIHSLSRLFFVNFHLSKVVFVAVEVNQIFTKVCFFWPRLLLSVSFQTWRSLETLTKMVSRGKKGYKDAGNPKTPAKNAIS